MEASAVPRRARIHVPLGRTVLSRLGDEALVDQVRHGNERAFEVIYDRYHAGLLTFCRHMLGSADEAEDALQQSFVSAHADLLRSSRPIALKAWLYTIARNRCVSMLRARREQSAEFVDAPTERLSDEVERKLELRALLEDLRDLPDDQREALVLAEVADLSHEEIGQIVGCQRNKVKALIFQARSALIEARKARETPCAEIREQLATLRGGALRRSELRRHVKACPGCAEFREEVRRQRAMLAVLLPVAPSLGLKRSVLAAAGIGSGGAGAGGAGLVAGVAAKGGAAKLVMCGVLGTLAVGGGVALEERGDLPFGGGGHAASPPAATEPAAQARAVVGSALSTGAVIPMKVAPSGAVHAPSGSAPAATHRHHRHHGHANGHTKAHGHGHAHANTPPESQGMTNASITGQTHSQFGRSHKRTTPAQTSKPPPPADHPPKPQPRHAPPATPPYPGPTDHPDATSHPMPPLDVPGR